VADTIQESQTDEHVITIQADEPFSGGTAILDVIQQREIELKSELILARQKAEAVLSKARSEAASIKDKAAGRGQAKGAKIVEKGLTGAKTKAAEAIAETEAAKEKLLAQGRAHFDRAVDFVIRAVLAQTGGEG
jgi:vacuolar-type H+-ATPase subunit H